MVELTEAKAVKRAIVRPQESALAPKVVVPTRRVKSREDLATAVTAQRNIREAMDWRTLSDCSAFASPLFSDTARHTLALMSTRLTPRF